MKKSYGHIAIDRDLEHYIQLGLFFVVSVLAFLIF